MGWYIDLLKVFKETFAEFILVFTLKYTGGSMYSNVVALVYEKSEYSPCLLYDLIA